MRDIFRLNTPYMKRPERDKLTMEGLDELDNSTNIYYMVIGYIKTIKSTHEYLCEALYILNKYIPSFEEYITHYIRARLIYHYERKEKAINNELKEVYCLVELEKKYPFPKKRHLRIKPRNVGWNVGYCMKVDPRPMGPRFKLPKWRPDRCKTLDKNSRVCGTINDLRDGHPGVDEGVDPVHVYRQAVTADPGESLG